MIMLPRNCARTISCPRPAYNKVGFKYFCAEHTDERFIRSQFNKYKSTVHKSTGSLRCNPMKDSPLIDKHTLKVIESLE